MSLQAIDITRRIGSSKVKDIVLFETGELRTPLRIISDGEAVQFCINLINCLSEEQKQYILGKL